jgi:dephospho-CoA kinase
MLTLKKVAVTGGLASGKTSVCHILETCGAYVVNADEIVHRLLSPSTLIGQQIISKLGADILNENQIDRTKVAEKVFSNPEKLHELEKLLHPAVLDEIKRCYQLIGTQNTYTLFVAEIPLLFESDSENFFDIVIAVVSDENLCRQRFQQTTHYPSTEYNRRMKRQLPPVEKAARADYTIINDGSFEELKNNVINLFQTKLRM